MTIEQMRTAIRKAYTGQAWQFKVDTMPDAQVLAVYKRLLASNKL